MYCHARLLSNNYSAPVANGHKVAAGGSVASSTTTYTAEQQHRRQCALRLMLKTTQMSALQNL